MTISAQTAMVLGAVLAVLLVLTFSAGRRYESMLLDSAQQSSETEGWDGQSDSEPLGAGELSGDQPADGAASPGPTPAARSGASESPATGETRRVTLQQGYHYVIVQHFGKKRQDALDTARFLQQNGVQCATMDGSDIRVVATQPFLIKQADAAAARRERQRAEELRRRIRTLGKEFDKLRRKQGKGGYTLSGCYLLEVK